MVDCRFDCLTKIHKVAYFCVFLNPTGSQFAMHRLQLLWLIITQRVRDSNEHYLKALLELKKCQRCTLVFIKTNLKYAP